MLVRAYTDRAGLLNKKPVRRPTYMLGLIFFVKFYHKFPFLRKRSFLSKFRICRSRFSYFPVYVRLGLLWGSLWWEGDTYIPGFEFYEQPRFRDNCLKLRRILAKFEIWQCGKRYYMQLLVTGVALSLRSRRFFLFLLFYRHLPASKANA